MENALKDLEQIAPTHLKITVVGKVAQFYSNDDSDDYKNLATLKMYWNQLLGGSTTFASFKNAVLGNIFIAGPLASTFLGEVNGKTLGTLSVGPYGIMMGMGATVLQAKTFIEMLHNGCYLLLLRGQEQDLEQYKNILEKTKSQPLN